MPKLMIGAAIAVRPELRIFIERVDLLESLHGVNYAPAAICPQCRYLISVEEILTGFRPDPNDSNIECRRCQLRFKPWLIVCDRDGRRELPFFCSAQALARMPAIARLMPEEIARNHQAIYHSAMVHFGSLKAAFNRAGIYYRFDKEPRDWRQKVEPFLGHLPDTIIADCVNMSPRTIGRMRRRIGLKRFQA